jgi:N-hydroxyarylamine O-acetyltransferase
VEVPFDVNAYLDRIGLDHRPPRDVSGLETLQRAHLTAVPFENLPVYAQRGVGTGLDWSIPKIVLDRRGGWCFELNGAFGALLENLGFQVERRAAVVLLEGDTGEPSHSTILVHLDETYVVDVGFGDSFIRPLRVDLASPQDGGTGEFVVTHKGDTHTVWSLDTDGSLQAQYRFDQQVRSLDDFAPHSHRLQTNPSSRWLREPFATRLLDGGPGRVTLLHDRIKFRREGAWEEYPVARGDWDAMLERWFGLAPVSVVTAPSVEGPTIGLS